MEISQEVALQSSSYKPITLFRYVDDTFIIWPQSKHNLHIFLEHYYNQHNDIKLKMDIYSNNSFPFLDLLVSRLPNGLGHSACRKLTDMHIMHNPSIILPENFQLPTLRLIDLYLYSSPKILNCIAA